MIHLVKRPCSNQYQLVRACRPLHRLQGRGVCALVFIAVLGLCNSSEGGIFDVATQIAQNLLSKVFATSVDKSNPENVSKARAYLSNSSFGVLIVTVLLVNDEDATN